VDRFQVTSRLTEFWIDAGKTATVTNIGSTIVYGSPDAPPTSTTTAAWSLAPGASRVEDVGAVWVLTAAGTSSTLTVEPIASGLAVDTGTGVPSAVGSGGSASTIVNVPAGNIAATDVQSALNELDSEKQPLDTDLTVFAAISPSNDDLVQRKAGAWTNRTPAQVKTDLALVKGDVGLGNVDNTSDANKPVSTATQTALDLKAPKTESLNTVATSSTAQTLADPSTSSINYITLTANCTLTFPTAVAGKSFTLALKQDGTGSRTVTWPSSGTLSWPGGTAPTLTTTANKIDFFSFVCVDGTHWDGFTAGLNFA
jgi:hypothetical protein